MHKRLEAWDTFEFYSSDANSGSSEEEDGDGWYEYKQKQQRERRKREKEKLAKIQSGKMTFIEAALYVLREMHPSGLKCSELWTKIKNMVTTSGKTPVNSLNRSLNHELKKDDTTLYKIGHVYFCE